ncbi:penicillin-binding protein [Colidextribacter sp. OB.20]|uniref:penicillin-binding transpeptidase domain-containing protein n=1 Tax=Colidextribacter sp. OB.20 TaxID=2304568 RepID=UPI00136BFBF5|nr:penicillin-binding transpeptidase domain-containing protein [Colidextribacter sp. OB.20]NBI10352.1 penicillin-binding protein [Colidextribacter sp. OB.20]
MDSKQFHRRVWAMVLLLALMVTTMGAALYDLQINNGDELRRQTQKKIAEEQSVPAARGQILDRNGQVLVSNKVVYQVTLDTKQMGDERCQTILELIRIARSEEVEWADSLPISQTAPLRFTTDMPYYTIGTGEDGNVARSLTRLGKLAVKQKWVDDPTAAPETEEESPAPAPEPGFLDKLKSFLKGGSGQQATAKTKEPKPLLGAEELLGKMCASFEIKGEGAVDEKEAKKTGETVPVLNIGDMSKEDARAVAGVLYELYLRSTGVYIANEYVFAQDVDIDFISRVKERGLTGVIIEATTVRQYHTQYAAHLLGRVALMDKDEWAYYKTVDEDGDGVPDYQMNNVVGKEGVEQAFESYLRGRPGTKAVERNTKGQVVSETWRTEPEPGGNVVLTLDIGLQGYVENVLAESVPKLPSEKKEGAACVVLDVKSSEVLAAASYPTFDLTNYAQELKDKGEDPLKPFLNRAFQGAYPPGSTFKPLTAIAGLEEEGIITPTTVIRDLGQYNYYGPNGPKCWIYRQGSGTHGSVNVSKAIEVSCNYFFFEVGRQLGISRLDDYAARFGLGEKTGIELEERTGVMASPEYTESHGQTWYDGNTLSVAIGQESSQFTPLQLANYIATLVNGGTRRAVHMLKEVKSSDFSQVIHSYEPQVLETIEIHDQNLKAVKAGMLALTTQGSVRNAFLGLPFQVGAKTGSAQTGLQSDSHAVFVCFAPFDDPEIAVAMAVEHGGSGGELAYMAADVLSYYFSSKETREEIPVENTLVR